jgi:uncharacterized membrane protein
MNQPLMKKERIFSVDMLRGWVMIVMALDHIRDYTSIYHFDPEDLSQSSVTLFFTRWVTHFCAPVFMFVAGTGTGLGAINGKTKNQLSYFLWTRGLWLILLEFTVIRFGWEFHFREFSLILIVIWALGMSMLALAALIYIPKKWLLFIGLVMVFGHNLLDEIRPEQLGGFSALWKILHVQSSFNIGSLTVRTIYPLIPWIGVMALGYVFADFYRLEVKLRQKWMLLLGFAITGLFFIVRGINVYGDPEPWSAQATFGLSVASFFNTTKYPPSLSYLLMTLGPSIIILVVLEKVKGRIAAFLIVFGRVPMFYYIVHIYLIHLIAVFLGFFQGFTWHDMAVRFRYLPEDYGFGLGVTYAVWLLTVAILYPLCKSYIKFKSSRKHPFYSYI